MLEISTSKWHYRLWKIGRARGSEPHNLCKYFWHIVLFKLVLPLAGVGLVLFGVGSILWVIWLHPVEAALGTFAAFLIVVLVVLLGWLLTRRAERRKVKRRQQRLQPARPAPPKEPSVLWAYLKARKQKVCPLIKVVDRREEAG